jgi:hypothetical protein
MRWEQKVVDQSFKEQAAELMSAGRLADKIDRERVELFQILVNHPAWKVYIELLGTLIQQTADEVIAPAGSIDRAVALEYVKGALSGLIRARDLPSSIIATMKAAVPATDGDDE